MPAKQDMAEGSAGKQQKDFRDSKEKPALYFSLSCIGFFIFILLGLHPGVLFVLLAISIIMVKLRQGQFLGHTVKMGELQSFGKVYDSAKLAAERLAMKMPDIFIKQDPVINAFALGFLGKKSVVLNSGTVESMTPMELTAIIGHELSHIRCSHTNWIVIAGSTDAVRIPILSDILGLILMMWSRRAELSADRGALLASRDINATVSALAKVAVGEQLYHKLNIDEFVAQAKAVDEDVVSRLGGVLSTHPYLVRRLSALLAFSTSKEYNDILNNGLRPDLCAGEIIEIARDHIYKQQLKEEKARLQKELTELREQENKSNTKV